MKIIRKYLNDYKNPSLKAWVLHFEKTITGKEITVHEVTFYCNCSNTIFMPNVLIKLIFN